MYQILFQYWQPTEGFSLETRSESPIGGGLGGSSSLLMSCLKAFSQWLKKPLSGPEMVRVASNIEAQMLRKPTGTQDYIPALYPSGINVIDYSVAGTQVTAVQVPASLFHNRFLLVYTGRSHNSGINNWDVIKKVLDGDPTTLFALGEIRQVADELRHKCMTQDWSGWPALFERETHARLALSPSFSSPEIIRLTQLALSEGVEAVKICGAGGGGCVFLWTPESAFTKVKAACQHEGYQVLNAKPLV
jgi:D-glycero-alpha-D-manno-heptose-7-phosphate kinase